MSRIKLIVKNIYRATESIFYNRDSSIALFGAWFGDRYADNPRYLYQFLSDNKEKYGFSKVIWVTRNLDIVKMLNDKGYESYLMDSKQSIYYHKKAMYHFVCDAPFSSSLTLGDIEGEYSFGAKRINLWHGVVAFKGVRRASKEYIDAYQKHRLIYGIKEALHKNSLYRKICEQPGGWGDAYYCGTTVASIDILKKFFKLPSKNYIGTGSPRVCASPWLTKHEEEIIRRIKTASFSVLYLPTMRSKDSSFDFAEASEGIVEYLEENNVLWIQKPHSADMNNNKGKIVSNSIINIDNKVDINIIIKHVNMIVTDYSSVIGEAMFYFKPISFYVPDFEEYRNGDRGFIIDPNYLMCGKICYTVEELKQSIIDTKQTKYVPDDKYLNVRKEYVGDEVTMDVIWNDIKKATNT